MQSVNIAGSALSRLDGQSLTHPPMMTHAGSVNDESAWLSWGRSAFAVAVVILLMVLGAANIEMRARWHEVEDGVLWAAHAEGVVATEIATGSAAAAAGIERGDVLIAIDGASIETPADVVEHDHRGVAGTPLNYPLLRPGTRQALEISLAPAPPG